MKKALIGALLALSVAACSPSSEENAVADAGEDIHIIGGHSVRLDR